MDPHYFIDGLSIAPNDDNLELQRCHHRNTPEGWLLGVDDSQLIIYNGDAYNYIFIIVQNNYNLLKMML